MELDQKQNVANMDEQKFKDLIDQVEGLKKDINAMKIAMQEILDGQDSIEELLKKVEEKC